MRKSIFQVLVVEKKFYNELILVRYVKIKKSDLTCSRIDSYSL